MSLLTPVDEEGIVEELIIRKPNPASVSCEARTPRCGNTESENKTSKQNGNMSKVRKGQNNLTKGKMEIFQVIAEQDIERIPSFNDSFNLTTPRYPTGYDKDLWSTPRRPEDLDQSSTFDKDSTKSDANLEILEKLNALETSLAAMAATKERQTLQESDVQRIILENALEQQQVISPCQEATPVSDSISKKKYSENHSKPQMNYLKPRQNNSLRYGNKLGMVNIQVPVTNKMASANYNTEMNSSFAMEINNSIQPTGDATFGYTQGQSCGYQHHIQQSSVRGENLATHNISPTTNSFTPYYDKADGYSNNPAPSMDTQSLLYKVQQDMIARQKETAFHDQSLLNQSSFDLLNKSNQGFHQQFTGRNFSQSNCQPLNQCGHHAFNQSECYNTSSCAHQQTLSTVSQSDYGNFNQSGACNFNQSMKTKPQPQCENCYPQTKNPRTCKIDFTKSNPTANLTLMVSGTRLFIHKEVISAWSNRWRHLVRVNSMTGDEIILRDTNLATVLALLDYIYGIHKTVSDDNVYLLLELADKFEMPKIKTECERFLLEKHPEIKLLLTGQNYRLQKLYKKNLEFVTKLDLQTLERDSLFPQLNATTTASIYKAEISRLRAQSRTKDQQFSKTEQRIKKMEKGEIALRKKFDEILKQWSEKRNQCHQHCSVTGMSDLKLSCTECNNRVYKQVKRICEEVIGGSNMADVSIISENLSD